MPEPTAIADLPPFDPGRRCPKCQSAAVKVRHEPTTDHFSCTVARDHAMPLGGTPLERWNARWNREHLERSCERCGFGWSESVPPPPPPRTAS